MIAPQTISFLTKISAATSVIAVFAAAVCLAETYRWTDKKGNVGFADSLQSVPEQYRESAKRMDGNSGGPTTKPLQIIPSVPQSNTSAPPAVDSEELYGTWRERAREARADLEQLKIQREATQKEYDTLRGEGYGRLFSDATADEKYRTTLAELDRQISQKEQEITTTLPDQARKAGIPPGVLNQ